MLLYYSVLSSTSCVSMRTFPDHKNRTKILYISSTSIPSADGCCQYSPPLLQGCCKVKDSHPASDGMVLPRRIALALLSRALAFTLLWCERLFAEDRRCT